MTAHKHAVALIALANGQEVQFALGGPEKWEDWTQPHHDRFSPLFCADGILWRVKPKTIRIGERDVPAPMTTAPEIGEHYWYVDLNEDDVTHSYEWKADRFDLRVLKRGFVHDNREAALAHAEALILVSGGTL